MSEVMDPRWAYWVTLYTDASYHPERGGSYGCRTRNGFEPFRTEIHGKIEPCADNVVAEVAAIVIGIEHVLATWERVDGVGVNSDCQPALDILKYGANPHRRADLRGWQERLRASLGAKEDTQRSPVYLRMKWVKGHQGRGTTRGWLNARVDSLSRKG